jgi:hypothetical protein
MSTDTRKTLTVLGTLFIVGGALIGVGHILGRWPS